MLFYKCSANVQLLSGTILNKLLPLRSVLGTNMKFVLSLVITLLIIFTNLFSMQAVAQGSYLASTNVVKVNQQSRKQQPRIKNANQAAQVAQSRFGGKVLKVQAKKSGYQVKLIKQDGHIISIFVDAKSGRISGR